MDESKYWNVLRPLTKEQRLIFDNIIYRKKMYPNIPRHIYLTRGAKTSYFFTLNLIIQGILWLYNKNLSSNLTKSKALRMASTSKVA